MDCTSTAPWASALARTWAKASAVRCTTLPAAATRLRSCSTTRSRPMFMPHLVRSTIKCPINSRRALHCVMTLRTGLRPTSCQMCSTRLPVRRLTPAFLQQAGSPINQPASSKCSQRSHLATRRIAPQTFTPTGALDLNRVASTTPVRLLWSTQTSMFLQSAQA